MKTTCCFLLVLIFACAPAFAGDVTLFGGVQVPGKLTLQSAAGSGSTVGQIFSNPFDVGVFGLRFGNGKVVGAEHTLAYASNFIDSNTRAFVYNSNIMIQVPTPTVKPYVTAGAGAIFTHGTGISDIGTKFALNYGGGVKLMPKGPVGGRIDVRGYTVPRIQGQTWNIFEVSLGVVFRY